MADTKGSALTTDTALGAADYVIGVQDVGGTPVTVKFSQAAIRNSFLSPFSTTDDATSVINCDTYNEYYLTAIANATEFSVTGTPTTGMEIFIGFKDAGVSKALTWTGITGLGQVLPTSTVASKWHIVRLKYIGAWYAIAVGVEA